MCCQSHKSSIASSPEVLKWRNWKPPTHIAPSRGDTEAHIARLLVSTLGLHCGNAMVLAVEIASFEKRPTTAPPQLEDKLYFLGKQRKLAIEKSARFAASMERLSQSASIPVDPPASRLSNPGYYEASPNSARRFNSSTSACGYSSSEKWRTLSSRRGSTLSDSCVHC